VLARRPDRRPDGTAVLGVAPRSLRLGGVRGRFRFSCSERLFRRLRTRHGPRVLLLIITYVSAPVSPTIADSFGIAFKGASAPAPGPSPRPSAHLTPICISRRALWRACGVSTPFPHLCYDLGVPPRPPPLHERVHAAIGMLRVPPSPCESLPRQAYGYSLTVLHAAARAAHLTGSAEDARASSLSRHMRP
jgi:hypothetical protein